MYIISTHGGPMTWHPCDDVSTLVGGMCPLFLLHPCWYHWGLPVPHSSLLPLRLLVRTQRRNVYHCVWTGCHLLILGYFHPVVYKLKLFWRGYPIFLYVFTKILHPQRVFMGGWYCQLVYPWKYTPPISSAFSLVQDFYVRSSRCDALTFHFRTIFPIPYLKGISK